MGGGRGSTVCGEDGVGELEEGVAPTVEALVERAAEAVESIGRFHDAPIMRCHVYFCPRTVAFMSDVFCPRGDVAQRYVRSPVEVSERRDKRRRKGVLDEHAGSIQGL